MSEAVLGQAQLSLNHFELKPRFVRGLKKLEAHFIEMALTKIDMCCMYATFIMHSLQHMCILHLCVICKQNALNCSMCPACMHKESNMHTCSLHMCHIYLPCTCARFYVPHAC